jgi:LPS sulfotransferase NodH
MLCDVLTQSGVAGRPNEFFHRRALADAGQVDRSLSDLQNHFKSCIATSRTPNGVFGMKLHFNQFANLFAEQRFGLKAGAAFLSGFQKFILVYRRDKVLQAISEMLAGETKVWNSTEVAMRGRNGRDYAEGDTVTISRIMNRLITEEQSWRDIMRQIERVPLEIAYEDMVADTEGAIANVFAELGLDVKESVAPQTQKIADENAALMLKRRFLKAIGAF